MVVCIDETERRLRARVGASVSEETREYGKRTKNENENGNENENKNKQARFLSFHAACVRSIPK